jgi:exportin-7
MLCSLWQRMVASVPYVKATEPHLLETYTPEVTQAYITSRLESVAVVVRDGLEDPLDDLGMLGQQLDQLSGGICLLYTCCQGLCTFLSRVADPGSGDFLTPGSGLGKNKDPEPF